MSKLALGIQKCDITLFQLGFISDIDNTENLRKIPKRLQIRVKWVNMAHNIAESRMASFMYSINLVKGKSETKVVDKHISGAKGKILTFKSRNINPAENVRFEHKCGC